MFLLIDKIKNDRSDKNFHYIWLDDESCIDIFMKDFMKENNLIYNRGKWKLKETLKRRRTEIKRNFKKGES